MKLKKVLALILLMILTFTNVLSASYVKAADVDVRRSSLTSDERNLVNSMERFLLKEISTNLITDNLLLDAVAALAFDTAFNKDSVIFGLLEIVNGNSEDDEPTQQAKEWFDSLSNVSLLTLNTYEVPTGNDITVYARYIDNQSDTTVTLHHGYRSTYEEQLPQAKYYSEMGFNVLLPEVRAHDNSTGKYITFGYYEKNDLNMWLDQETTRYPDQKIIVSGVSMGAATTLQSQETTHSNVVAVIADCSYATLDQQLRDVIRMLTDYLQYIDIFNIIDWYGLETDIMTRLNNKFVRPILKMNISDVSPLRSVAGSDVPKLFIHGDADTLIKPIALELLYNNAIGYKKYQYVEGAEHGASFKTDPETYKNAVETFLEEVGI